MKPERLPYLDVLRGVAILLVVAVHLGQRLPGTNFAQLSQYGQYGVQLFFVVSAYSLCLSWSRHPADGTYSAFMVRRYFRIAPMYYVALVIFFASTAWLEWTRLAAVFYTPTAGYTLSRVAANLLLVHGLVEDANNRIVPGGWSIGCEFLFYALFPALVRALSLPALLLGLAGLAAGVVTLVRMHFPASWQIFQYYGILCQLPCFLLGMAAYGWRDRRWFTRLALALAPLALYALYRAHHVSWGWTVSPLCAAVAAAGLLAGGRALAPEGRVIARIGQWSFSIYCLHYLFVRLAGDPLIAGWRDRGWPMEVGTVGIYLVVVALSCIVAAFTYRYVELPGMQVGRRLASRLTAATGIQIQ